MYVHGKTLKRPNKDDNVNALYVTSKQTTISADASRDGSCRWLNPYATLQKCGGAISATTGFGRRLVVATCQLAALTFGTIFRGNMK